MNLLRSFASVLVSYIVVFLIVFLSDPVLAHLFPGQYVRGQVPPATLLWIDTAIFAAASIVGGWLCALMAPSRPGMHLFLLFLIGEMLGVATTIASWNKWPHWHSLVWLLLWPVCLWLGALGRRGSRRTSGAAIT